MSTLQWLDSAISTFSNSATVAILATRKAESERTVAGIATVAKVEDSAQREVTYLIVAVAEREDWPAAQTEEAARVALADHVAALTCWRAIGREYGIAYPPAAD